MERTPRVLESAMCLNCYGSAFALTVAFFVGPTRCSDAPPKNETKSAEAHVEAEPVLAGVEQPERSEAVQHQQRENVQIAMPAFTIQRSDKLARPIAVAGHADNPIATTDESFELPDTAKVLAKDTLIVPSYTPEPLVSPDHQTIAFVSSGSVFTCGVNGGPPRALAPIPDTMSAVLSEPQYAEFRESKAALARLIISKEFRSKVRPQIRRFHGFKWSRAGDAILFGIDPPRAASNGESGWEIHRIALDGTDSILATIPPAPGARGIVSWDLVDDGNQILIERTQSNAVRYDIRQKQFHDLPFAELTPANDGSRFMGIESESNQLVSIDRHFNVTKRFDIYAPEKQFSLDLRWSPNQAFLLWRRQTGFDHYSNWAGFRLDLATGQRRELTGLFFREHIQFTGHGGELIQCGLTGRRSTQVTGDEILGAHLLLIPEGSAPTKVLWNVDADSPKDVTVSLGRLHDMPPFVASSDGELFAIGIPRPRGEPHGWVWHLVNRKGEVRPLPGKDTGGFISPYTLIGFADSDGVVVARDDSRILAIPIQSP